MAPLRLFNLALCLLLAASVVAVAQSQSEEEPVASSSQQQHHQRMLMNETEISFATDAPSQGEREDIGEEEEGDETLNDLLVDLEEIEEKEDALENAKLELIEAIEEEAGADDDYVGCLCPCELAADPEGGVGMYAVDESLIALMASDGSNFVCVVDEASVRYNAENKAVCDDSCFDDGDDLMLYEYGDGSNNTDYDDYGGEDDEEFGEDDEDDEFEFGDDELGGDGDDKFEQDFGDDEYVKEEEVGDEDLE